MVSVHMIPDVGMILPVMAGAQSSISSPGAFLESDWGKAVPVGLLTLGAVFIIFMMIRWATRQPKMPTVDELAGVPPVLPIEDDLIGEADAQDPTMAGVELDEYADPFAQDCRADRRDGQDQSGRGRIAVQSLDP